MVLTMESVDQDKVDLSGLVRKVFCCGQQGVVTEAPTMTKFLGIWRACMVTWPMGGQECGIVVPVSCWLERALGFRHAASLHANCISVWEFLARVVFCGTRPFNASLY